MRLINLIAGMFLLSVMWGAAIGTDPVDIFAGGMLAAVAVAAVGGSGLANALFEGGTSIQIGPIADELRKFIKVETGGPRQWFYYDKIQLRPFARKVAKVMGEYHVPKHVMESVLQAFRDTQFDRLGKSHFSAKKLKNWHLKFNVPIRPYEIYASYLADLYDENKKLQDKSIARYIMNNLGTRVIHDLDILSIDGVFDSALANTEMGYAMDGIVKILTDGAAATLATSTEHPFYIIPAKHTLAVDAADDIVAEVRHFERQIPRRLRSRVKNIFLERYFYDEYMDQYRLTHAADTNFKEGDMIRTYGGRNLVPVDSESMGNLIFATVEDNLIEMVDLVDIPRLTEVQTQDYEIKLFGEGRYGIDFAINQAVLVRSETADKTGLQVAAQDKLYFDTKPAGGSGSGS